MFIYLSKKIKVAIPNPIPLQSLGWNIEHGWIAVGGDEGLLKVLKLDNAESSKPQSNLTMNQTLEGHNGQVRCVVWNQQYRKLTTSDEHGLIIVWMLFKGQWYEEMINNRNKSKVKSMKWNADGQKICIVYEDGAVIVGGVDGNRLWGKELKLPLRLVEWAPNSKQILFGTQDGNVHVFDYQGNPNGRIGIKCLEGLSSPSELVGIEWYDGSRGLFAPDCPTLAICYDNGRMQIMKDETDTAPILIDSMMKVSCIKWSHNGNILAVGGSQSGDAGGETNVVQFYTPLGEHLRTLKVPGKQLKDLSWEGTSLRLALAVDHFIYFANVRPDYKWGYFGTTVVYAFTKPERTEHCVVFWDVKLNGRYIKYVKNLIGIAAAGQHCILATKADDNSGQYVLILCNAIGTPVDSKYIDIEPLYVQMTDTHVVAASHECVYVWNYKAAGKQTSDKMSTKKRDEKIFHIDDSPSGGKETDISKFKKAKTETRDPICCVCISNTTVMVGRDSGTLHQYSLPRVTLEMKHILNCRPDRISLNCNSTRLAIIDISGVLTFFDPEVKKTNPETGQVQYGEHIPSFERKDVWDMKWSNDNPELFSMMERNFLYIFRGLDPEEPINSTGFICSFDDLQIRSVLLDEIMAEPERPTKEECIDMDIKSLRDTRILLKTVTIEDTYSFIEQNPHPRLWRLLAESSLEKLDFEIAEKAFVRCQDFQGIEFVKRLQRLNDRSKQTAEVAAYFRRFEEAEQHYLQMDRRDLAINMRQKMGDYFRVVQLLRAGGGGEDQLMNKSWNAIGDYYADRQHWEEAVKYYLQGSNKKRLADCYYRLEDYAGLESLVESLVEGDDLLNEIADMFVTVGLCSPAVNAYIKNGKVKEAISVCISLNQWDLAVSLAKQHNVKEIDALLAKYASHLLTKENNFEAIELYRKANHHLDAAKLLFQLAEQVAAEGSNPLRAKQLYVLGALEIEAYHDAKRAAATDAARSALDGLLDDDGLDHSQTKMIESAWRGAEAFHFFCLAQRQLYAGRYQDSLRTAVRLTEYDDILNPVQAYSILALAAVANKSYGMCSKAFIKLESLGSLTDKARSQYEELALQIFTKHAPKDPPLAEITCPQCDAKAAAFATGCPQCNTPFLPSVVSGRPLVEHEFWICGTCKHRASANEISSLSTCPMCHADV